MKEPILHFFHQKMKDSKYFPQDKEVHIIKEITQNFN